MKRIYIILLRLLGLVLLTGGLVLALHRVMAPGVPKEAADFYFLQTAEDADCTLLLSGGKSVMIDTGEAQDYEAICALLRQKNVSRIDCLILTHPDKDHIGSAQALAQTYPIGLVVEPYYAKEKDSFRALNDALDVQGIPRLVLARPRHFTYGDLRLVVYPPEETSYQNDNNYSLAIAVKHGETELFFPGDAYTARTGELLRLPLHPVDLYHASYHGRDYENGLLLLDALDPRYVIVTADQAGKDTGQALDGMGAQVFYTPAGTVWMQSNGTGLLPAGQ